MSFNGQISGSLAPQGNRSGSVSGSIGAVVPDIRDGSVTTAKLADAAVTIAKLAADVTALINSKGDASDVATLQSDVEALQTITAGLGTASTYGVANNLTQAAAGANVLDAYQGKLLGDRMTTAEGDIDTLNDGYANLGLICTTIVTVRGVPTTATSYSCNWAQYDLLIINTCFFRNVYNSYAVTKEYMSRTDSSARVVSLLDTTTWDVYKNGDNALYIKASGSSANAGVDIIGVKLAK